MSFKSKFLFIFGFDIGFFTSTRLRVDQNKKPTISFYAIVIDIVSKFNPQIHSEIHAPGPLLPFAWVGYSVFRFILNLAEIGLFIKRVGKAGGYSDAHSLPFDSHLNVGLSSNLRLSSFVWVTIDSYMTVSYHPVFYHTVFYHLIYIQLCNIIHWLATKAYCLSRIDLFLSSDLRLTVITSCQTCLRSLNDPMLTENPLVAVARLWFSVKEKQVCL